MKKYIFLIFLFSVFVSLIGQNKNLEAIKKYYYSIDKNQLTDSLLEVNIENYKESFDLNFLEISIDSAINIRSKEIGNIRSDNSLIILILILKNIENYTFKKNIYDFLYIDPTDIQIRYYNKLDKTETILSKNKFLENIKYYEKKEILEFEKTVDLINKEKNAIWLLGAGTIFSDFKYDSGNTNYIFLKNDEIYVYRSRHKDFYELNQFVRKFFNEKKFKKRAVFELQLITEGYSFVGKKIRNNNKR